MRNRIQFLLAITGILLVAPSMIWAQCGASSGTGKLEVNSDAALEGLCGLEILMDGTTTNRFVSDSSPNDETVYRASFLFNPNDFAFNGGTAAANRHLIFGASAWSSNNPLEPAIRVIFARRVVSDDLIVKATSANTAGSKGRVTKPIHLQSTAGPSSTYLIEVEWQRASAPGVADGVIRIRVDGGAWSENASVKSTGQLLRSARLGGMTVIDAGSTGSYYLDDFQSFRTLAP
jgi:hypothetical protein